MSDVNVYEVKDRIKSRAAHHFHPDDADYACHKLAQFFTLMDGITKGDKLSERSLIRLMNNKSEPTRPYIHSLGIWLGCSTKFISSLRDNIPDALRLYYSGEIHHDFRIATRPQKKKRKFILF